MTDEEMLQTYGKYMAAVKLRLAGAAKVATADLNHPFIVEDSIALQLRLVIEAMYLASVCANAVSYAEKWKDIRKANGHRIVSQRRSGTWWPRAARPRDLIWSSIDIEVGQPFGERLARSAYGRCGDLLHHKPAFGGGPLLKSEDLNEKYDFLQPTMIGIIEHLAFHVIELEGVDRRRMIVCHMRPGDDGLPEVRLGNVAG